MSAEQLWDTTMNPEVRERLYQRGVGRQRGHRGGPCLPPAHGRRRRAATALHRDPRQRSSRTWTSDARRGVLSCRTCSSRATPPSPGRSDFTFRDATPPISWRCCLSEVAEPLRRPAHPLTQLVRRLRRERGLDLDAAAHLLRSQRGGCGGCRQPGGRLARRGRPAARVCRRSRARRSLAEDAEAVPLTA